MVRYQRKYKSRFKDPIPHDNAPNETKWYLDEFLPFQYRFDIVFFCSCYTFLRELFLTVYTSHNGRINVWRLNKVPHNLEVGTRQSCIRVCIFCNKWNDSRDGVYWQAWYSVYFRHENRVFWLSWKHVVKLKLVDRKKIIKQKSN